MCVDIHMCVRVCKIKILSGVLYVFEAFSYTELRA
jgi:hypothetical protein